MKSKKLKNIDFLILTSLSEEFFSVLDAYSYDSEVGYLELPLSDNKARLIRNSVDNSVVTGIVACSNSMGATDLAIITSLLLCHYEFEIIILAGIAGGVQEYKSYNDVALGDVVLSESIINSHDIRVYSDEQYSMHAGNTTVMRPNIHYLKNSLRKFLIDFKRKNNKVILDYNNFRSNNNKEYKVLTSKIHIGSYITVNGVISNRDVSKSVLNDANNYFPHADVRAMEMEGYSVARSVQIISPETPFIICKGINDLLDRNKSLDESVWRRDACVNSAIVARKVILEFLRSHT